MKPATLREAYCERLRVAPEAFDESLLWRCFYPHRVWLGKLLWRWQPGYFAADLELIRSVADCTDLRDLRTELNDHRREMPIRGFRRNILCVRLSGRRLMNLAAELLG